MRKKRTLIHFALLTEAKPFIGSLKLHKISDGIYENDTLLLVVSGMGKVKTTAVLKAIFCEYAFEKAINIGIAGCSEPEVALGTLFCTNRELDDVPFASLQSFEKPVTCKENITTMLVDMEADTFLEIARLHVKDIFVFKIVSDYLSSTIPTKEFVTNLMQKNIKKIVQYV